MFLVGKPEGRRPLYKDLGIRCTMEDNLKIDSCG
jgi:hypothetical protein